jgi:hypothetical protein
VRIRPAGSSERGTITEENASPISFDAEFFPKGFEKVMDAKARVFRVAASLKSSPSRLSPIGRDKNFGYESL